VFIPYLSLAPLPFACRKTTREKTGRLLKKEGDEKEVVIVG